MAQAHFKKTNCLSLANSYGLRKTSRGQSISDRLEGSAQVYFSFKNRQQEPLPNQEIREELDIILRDTKRLIRSVEKLRPDARHALQQQIRHIEHQATNISTNATHMGRSPFQKFQLAHGLEFTRINMTDDAYCDVVYDEDAISDALKFLAVYAELAKGGLPKMVAGRKTNQALRMWVINIASLWRDFHGTPFKLNYPNGIPKSAAALFCIEALELIDPEIKTAEVVTAMRNFVSEQRKRKSSAIGAKSS